ncbi:hypothetical protein EJ05DRAFT_528048 [Pseudovirgaria hyperparasitica]|uniref:Uncharacterized protein n=1 Tax=Pseudovirgaria hyperparasitica TaxID=470096 RepID=A0A6A6W977_9PEZI|nr:uncharacterized protein EJ05DRAFT_528048 [Pseudovirgaria hyperparasitica]KAF2758749.1 hypothetical protein EJ05DRAFT_528048 [Pseudovirgaria hyperparasitica]
MAYFLLFLSLLLTQAPFSAAHGPKSTSPLRKTTITYGAGSMIEDLQTRKDVSTYQLARHSMSSFPPETDASKPCTDCYIVAMQADLTYLDGTPANWDSGVWLHHFMQFNNKEVDAVCGNMAGDLFFTSGNERPEWRLDEHGPWGYYVSKDAEWTNVVEIMNESGEDKEVQISVHYEWIPKNSPEGIKYHKAQLLWTNIGAPCGDGDVTLVPGISTYDSDSWTSTVAGRLLVAKSHVHDGGLNSTLSLNDQHICISEQSYGANANFVSSDGLAHVSGGSQCKDLGIIKVGDKLQYSVTYDSAKALKHDGKYDDIMGVSFMYVGEE